MKTYWIFWSEAEEMRKRQEVLSETFEGVAICPEYNHHRQAEELQRGKSCSNASRLEVEETGKLNLPNILIVYDVGSALTPSSYRLIGIQIA